MRTSVQNYAHQGCRRFSYWVHENPRLVPVLRVLCYAQLLQHQADVLALTLPDAKVHALAPAPGHATRSDIFRMAGVQQVQQRQLLRVPCLRVVQWLNLFLLASHTT